MCDKKEGVRKHSGKWLRIGLALFLFLGGVALTGAPQPPPGDLKKLSEANLAFACDLYARLKSDPGNLVVSPHGVFTVLAMVYAGARGETEREIARVLHLTLDQPAVHPAMAKVAKELQPRVVSHPEYKIEPRVLEQANGLWAQSGLGIEPAFQHVLTENYGASPRQVDFSSNPQKACDDINGWAGLHTHGRIPVIVQPGNLDADTRLMLASAIYFLGNWSSPFVPADTKDDYFKIPSTPKKKVPMMYQRNSFHYYEGHGLQLLRMGYQGTGLSMVILLPSRFTSGKIAAFIGAIFGERCSTVRSFFAPGFSTS